MIIYYSGSNTLLVWGQDGQKVTIANRQSSFHLLKCFLCIEWQMSCWAFPESPTPALITGNESKLNFYGTSKSCFWIVLWNGWLFLFCKVENIFIIDRVEHDSFMLYLTNLNIKKKFFWKLLWCFSFFIMTFHNYFEGKLTSINILIFCLVCFLCVLFYILFYLVLNKYL